MSKRDVKRQNARQSDTSEKEKKKGKGIMWVIFILVLCVFVYFSIKDAISYAELKKPVKVIEQDENLNDIDENIKTDAELEEKLRNIIEDSKLRVHINSNPVFKDAYSKGYLDIENKEPNKHAIYVEIKTEDGRTIYTSGQIPVGKAVYNACLDVRLEKGSYPCIAYFHSIDEETGEILGSAGASILITVAS